MKNIMKSLAVVGAVFSAALTAPAHAVEVVASTPELAAIAREVGGTHASVSSLARPEQDRHRVEARPTDVVRVSRARVLVRVGMDLDPWVDALLDSARNPRVQPGGIGYVDASRMIRKIEVPTDKITGASGDVHPEGNPHYYNDPANGKVVAYQVLLALRQVDPQNARAYDANYNRFAAEIDRRIAAWRAQLAPHRGKQVVTYHKEFEYFMKRFGIRPFGYLEPLPGIPPSGGHVNSLIQRMKGAGVRAVVIPSVYPMRFPNLLAKEAGARVEVVPYSVGARGTTNYFDYIDAIVGGFRRALA